jgi:hypothetical protein
MTYYDDHKDERLEYQKMYHTENRDKYLQYQRDYYETVLRTKREHIRRNKPPPSSKAGVIKVKKEKPPPILKALPVAPSILYDKRIEKKVINPFIVTFT